MFPFYFPSLCIFNFSPFLASFAFISVLASYLPLSSFYPSFQVTGDIHWEKPLFLGPNDDIPITNRAKRLQQLAADASTATIVTGRWQ
jgi:hypothetical protein